MDAETLDKAIEKLLEENPVKYKSIKRNRQRQKDLVSRARRNKMIVPQTVIDELIKQDSNIPISYFKISYESAEAYLGTAKGWYDNIKAISEHFGVPSSKIRLEKIVDYYKGDLLKPRWDGNFLSYVDYKPFETGVSRVYRSAKNITVEAFDKFDKKLRTVNKLYIPSENEDPRLIEEGFYMYDEDAADYLKEFGIVIKAYTRYNFSSDKYAIGYDERIFRKYDVNNKYGLYSKALREFPKVNYYGKTIPIRKGDERGCHNKLVAAINENIREGLAHLDGLDNLVLDYEDSAREIIYEYIW